MRWGLYPRLAVSLGVLLGIAMLSLGYMLVSDAGKRLETERLTVARTLAHTLADGTVDALSAEDYELMERWVSSILPGENYAYAFLSRPDGLILTHTRVDMVGRRTNIDAAPGPAPYTVMTRYDHRPVQEVVYPVTVGDKHLADAHVAYYLDQNRLLSSDMAIRILGLLALFLLLLLGATLLIIRRHTRPLKRLADSITRVSLGAARVESLDDTLLKRTDEVGTLAREYSNMLERLNSAYNELRSEEQRLRDRVEERTSELRQSNLELESFSYSVSHDLRAPLRAINGYSELLLEDYPQSLDTEGRRALRRICDNTRHMEQLISDLLALSQVSRREMVRLPVDLSAIVRELCGTLQKQQPDRNVEVQVNITMLVEGDPGLLRIAMQNLIDNAWKYTARADTPRIEFGSLTEEPGCFYLRDNGAGFDMRYADKLFGVFQRLHRAEEFEGTGIGLATVKRIIRRHGGTIRAESAPGEGATFYFTLTLARGQAPPAPD